MFSHYLDLVSQRTSFPRSSSIAQHNQMLTQPNRNPQIDSIHNTIQTSFKQRLADLVHHRRLKPGVGCPKYRWVGFTQPEVQNFIDNKKMQEGALQVINLKSFVLNR